MTTIAPRTGRARRSCSARYWASATAAVNLVEHAAKSLCWRPAGIAVPDGAVVTDAATAAAASRGSGPSVVKAQVAAGRRGKAGGIRRVDSAREAAERRKSILGMTIGGHAVERNCWSSSAVDDRARALCGGADRYREPPAR